MAGRKSRDLDAEINKIRKKPTNMQVSTLFRSELLSRRRVIVGQCPTCDSEEKYIGFKNVCVKWDIIVCSH